MLISKCNKAQLWPSILSNVYQRLQSHLHNRFQLHTSEQWSWFTNKPWSDKTCSSEEDWMKRATGAMATRVHRTVVAPFRLCTGPMCPMKSWRTWGGVKKTITWIGLVVNLIKVRCTSRKMFALIALSCGFQTRLQTRRHRLTGINAQTESRTHRHPDSQLHLHTQTDTQTHGLAGTLTHRQPHQPTDRQAQWIQYQSFQVHMMEFQPKERLWHTLTAIQLIFITVHLLLESLLAKIFGWSTWWWIAVAQTRGGSRLKVILKATSHPSLAVAMSGKVTFLKWANVKATPALLHRPTSAPIMAPYAELSTYSIMIREVVKSIDLVETVLQESLVMGGRVLESRDVWQDYSQTGWCLCEFAESSKIITVFKADFCFIKVSEETLSSKSIVKWWNFLVYHYVQY